MAKRNILFGIFWVMPFLPINKMAAQTIVNYITCQNDFSKYNVKYSYSRPIFFSNDSTLRKPIEEINQRIEQEINAIIRPNIKLVSRVKEFAEDSGLYEYIWVDFTVCNSDERFISISISNENQMFGLSRGFATYRTFTFITLTGEEVTAQLLKPQHDNIKLGKLINKAIRRDCKLTLNEVNFKKDLCYTVDGKNIGIIVQPYRLKGLGDSDCTVDNYVTISRNEFTDFLNKNKVTELLGTESKVSNDNIIHSRIEAKKTYFYNEPNINTVTKIYVVEGDPITIIEKKENWVKAMYYSPATGKIYTNWIEYKAIYRQK